MVLSLYYVLGEKIQAMLITAAGLDISVLRYCDIVILTPCTFFVAGSGS